MPEHDQTVGIIRPVILSGGSGTRLWPVSRSHYPKQFAPLLNDRSLFEATLKRVANRNTYAAPFIICNSEHRFFVLEILDRLGIADATILLEPIGRNTAAAALVTALYEKEPDMLHLVMPSDHLVGDETAFHAAVQQAAHAARGGHIVLFGITPSYAETGYGYILKDGPIAGSAVHKITLFTEKPDAARAQTLLEQGALWNSGMFLYAPSVVLSEAKTLALEHYKKCATAVQNIKTDYRCLLLGEADYATMQNPAFDTLIMEHTKRGAVLPCSMQWSDVGSWQALWQLCAKDANGNASVGPVVTQEVKGSYIHSEGPAVAVLGMEDCLVVATKDAVLVAPRSRSQDIKSLLTALENNHKEIATTHVCVPRPWGTYENIAEGKNFKVKHIIVKPGRSLSLQMHHHRAEHWVVVAGTAKVECDGVEKIIHANESIFVPKGATHRLSNPGEIDLQLIEVQSGDYVGEDDIVRFEDIYGRAPESKKK